MAATSIKMQLSSFGLCSRQRGSQCGSSRVWLSAFGLWFLWFLHLVCICVLGLWLLAAASLGR